MTFSPVAFLTHEVEVSVAIMPPAIETVNSKKTADRKTTILTVADFRLNRLRVAILMVKPVFDRGFMGEIRAASRSGFAPITSAKAKYTAKTRGTNQKLGTLL